MLRRTACHKIYYKDSDEQKAQFAKVGTRIQFGLPDERAHRLMGLIDSIPTMNLVGNLLEPSDNRSAFRWK